MASTKDVFVSFGYAKLIYFTMSMLVCSMATFVPVYLHEHCQIRADQLGIVATMSGVLFAGSMFWTSVADHFGRSKLLVCVCATGYAAVIVCLIGVKALTEGQKGSWLAVGLTTAVFGVSNFFLAALFPIVDADVVEQLKSGNRKESFGEIRLWGTVGHSAIIVGAGVAIEATHSMLSMFILMLASWFSFVLSCLFGMRNRATPNALSPHRSTHDLHQMWMRVKLLLRNGPFMTFLLVVTVIGWSRAVVTFWLSILFQVGQKRNSLEVALCSVVRVVSELAIFYWSKPLNARIGAVGMLAACQIAGTLRFAAYGWLRMDGYWWYASFGIELLKGVSSAAFTASAVELATVLVTGTNSKITRLTSSSSSGLLSTANASGVEELGARISDEDSLRAESKALALGTMYGIYNGLSGSLAGLTGAAILRYVTANDIKGLFRIGTGVSGLALVGYVVLMVRTRPLSSK